MNNSIKGVFIQVLYLSSQKIWGSCFLSQMHLTQTTLPPLDYSFQCASLTSGRGPDGAVGAEWPAYPQASYANQSKIDATAENDWIFCASSTIEVKAPGGRSGGKEGVVEKEGAFCCHGEGGL